MLGIGGGWMLLACCMLLVPHRIENVTPTLIFFALLMSLMMSIPGVFAIHFGRKLLKRLSPEYVPAAITCVLYLQIMVLDVSAYAILDGGERDDEHLVLKYASCGLFVVFTPVHVWLSQHFTAPARVHRLYFGWILLACFSVLSAGIESIEWIVLKAHAGPSREGFLVFLPFVMTWIAYKVLKRVSDPQQKFLPDVGTVNPSH